MQFKLSRANSLIFNQPRLTTSATTRQVEAGSKDSAFFCDTSHIPAEDENVVVNRPLVHKYFKTMNKVNCLKTFQTEFLKLVFEVHSNNSMKLKESLDIFCASDFEATLEKIKAVMRLNTAIGNGVLEYTRQDLQEVYSLIFEKFAKYEDAAHLALQVAVGSDDLQRADRLFERSIALFHKVQNPNIVKVKSEQILKCGRFKLLSEKKDNLNSDLIKYKLVDRISLQTFAQYKIKDGGSMLTVTEPYLCKISQAPGSWSAEKKILGHGLFYAVVQRCNIASGLAFKTLGSFKEAALEQMSLAEANALYCKIKKSQYADNLNFPLLTHKGSLQRAVKGINLSDFFNKSPEDRQLFMRNNLISHRALSKFESALKFLNGSLKFIHNSFFFTNIIIDCERKCFTLVGFSLAKQNHLAADEDDNQFIFSAADLGLAPM